MKSLAKFLKPKQRFRFKGERIINQFIKDDRTVYHFKNKHGVFSSDFYNEEVEILK